MTIITISLITITTTTTLKTIIFIQKVHSSGALQIILYARTI